MKPIDVKAKPQIRLPAGAKTTKVTYILDDLAVDLPKKSNRSKKAKLVINSSGMITIPQFDEAVKRSSRAK